MLGAVEGARARNGRLGEREAMNEFRTMWRRRVVPCVVVAGMVGLSGCDRGTESVYAEPGEPLPGLTQAQLERFYEGKELFDHQWTPEEGLGPLYMQFSCGACHDIPTIGGSGVEPLREAT